MGAWGWAAWYQPASLSLPTKLCSQEKVAKGTHQIGRNLKACRSYTAVECHLAQSPW